MQIKITEEMLAAAVVRGEVNLITLLEALYAQSLAGVDYRDWPGQIGKLVNHGNHGAIHRDHAREFCEGVAKILEKQRQTEVQLAAHHSRKV